jgi:hypothetical protein
LSETGLITTAARSCSVTSQRLLGGRWGLSLVISEICVSAMAADWISICLNVALGFAGAFIVPHAGLDPIPQDSLRSAC